MVRTPVCDKNGLKKGTWTPEEDKKLINYITRYGHWNWRLLPKFAGLARCGKSCRLRWLNYLRPNLKRGNYTEEEEEAIIKLHRDLGNRWSAIAAKMPGRTDNEIKNHWHTNLKKRESQLSNSEEQSPTQPTPIPHPTQDSSSSSPLSSTTTETEYNSTITSINNGNYMALEDEFGFLDSDTDLMCGSNFWLEPSMLDISYVPAGPDYFDIADNLWIWTHDN